MERVTVLLGDGVAVSDELIVAILRSFVPESCVLNVQVCREADRLLALAETASPDVCIITLNNVIYPEPYESAEERIEATLRLVSQMRDATSVPIIALSGWEPGAMLRKARDASADYFLPLPFCPNTLRAILKECLP